MHLPFTIHSSQPTPSAQVGADRSRQLRSDVPVFAAGSRELALIPGHSPPTHFHSEIAEIEDRNGVARDTHVERGGNKLRFREFVIFRPTLIYPEYLVAYRRVRTPPSPPSPPSPPPKAKHA